MLNYIELQRRGARGNQAMLVLETVLELLALLDLLVQGVQRDARLAHHGLLAMALLPRHGDLPGFPLVPHGREVVAGQRHAREPQDLHRRGGSGLAVASGGRPPRIVEGNRHV